MTELRSCPGGPRHRPSRHEGEKRETMKNVQSQQESHSLAGVLAALVRQPGQMLLRRWNWKSALLSSAFRGCLFFLTNLSAGTESAIAALVTELAFRATFSGFYGALTEAFRHVRPAWAATTTVMILLPVANHSVEFFVHWLRGTPKLIASIAASVAFTSVSTSFNLFAMRRGVLIVGEQRHTLAEDFYRIPGLVAAFAGAVASAVSMPFGRRRSSGQPGGGSPGSRRPGLHLQAPNG